ncbi:MAG: hydantoinase/oxoprolinase family protein [Promethearchaeati archaeon SRVP18_Atabeyarchaeia-1]
MNRTIIGWDIGGANTKASLAGFSGDKLVEMRSISRYFPIWLDGKEGLPEVLKELKEELLKGQKVDGIAVTMTAELSDAYYTKREGVNHILDSVNIAFPEMDDLIRVVDVEAKLRTVEESRKDPLTVAAANWPATAWLVARQTKDTILIDTGSTTTDIIPIRNGKIVAVGKTDPERLVSGELVFTGALRTPISAIVNTLTYHGKPCRVSSEKFALSADVHLILRHISEDEYGCDTADGRGRSRKDSLARLARVICADVEMLTEQEIVGLAREVHIAQLETIAGGISQVADRLHLTDQSKKRFVVTVAGLARTFLAAEAARRSGFARIISIEELLDAQSAVTAPSAAAAIMLNAWLLNLEQEEK